MIEFDPTDQESTQHEHWTSAEQLLKCKSQYLSLVSSIEFPLSSNRSIDVATTIRRSSQTLLRLVKSRL